MKDKQRVWICENCMPFQGEQDSTEDLNNVDSLKRDEWLANPTDMDKAAIIYFQDKDSLFLCRCTPAGQTLH